MHLLLNKSNDYEKTKRIFKRNQIKDGQQPKPSPLEVVSNTRFSY